MNVVARVARLHFLEPLIFACAGVAFSAFVLCSFSPPACATGAAGPDTVLILDSTVTGGASSNEATKAATLGYAVEVVDAAGWAAKSTADFATYRAIILGDPTCQSIGPEGAATANNTVWAPAVTGNVVLIGTDPTYHSSFGPGGAEGGDALTEKGIAFAADAPGKTGAYVTLSCYYHGTAPFTPIPLLDGFSPGGFTMTGVGCFDDAHIVATSAALAGLTDGNLSNWGCSVHEAFDTWPSDFLVLAIARNAGSAFTASDGTVGTPYILARGEVTTLGLSLAPVNATNPVGSAHTVTATLTDSLGDPVSGALIGFEVTAGPNVGTSGACNPSDCNTDALGQVMWTYSDTGGEGTDTILAFQDADASGSPDLGEPQTTALKTWVPPCAEPAGDCRAAEKSILVVKGGTDGAKRKLIWKWIKGASTSQVEFGDPTDTAEYSLCLFAGTGAAKIAATIPPDAMKWKAIRTKGYKYKDRAATADGVRRVVLTGSDQNEAKVIVRGKGANLPDVALPLVPPLIVQLSNRDSGVCWEASYDTADIKRNDNRLFKAKRKP